jgi:hypothetical protein
MRRIQQPLPLCAALAIAACGLLAWPDLAANASTRYTITSTTGQAGAPGPSGAAGPPGPQRPRGLRRAPGRRGRDTAPGTRSPTTAEQGTADATIAAAAIAFLALLGAVFGIVENRRVARRRLTYDLVGRLEALDLISHQALMSSFLRGGLRPPNVSEITWAAMNEQARLDARTETWQQISNSTAEEDRETVLRILAFPNMLEALAGMYNQKLLDRSIVKTRVEGEAKDFWTHAAWWIDGLRSQYAEYEGDKIFVDLEIMLRKLATQKRPRHYHE